MNFDLPHLAPLVTRFRLLEILEHSADMVVVRAEDTVTGGRARIVFLRETDAETTPTTQLVALTAQGPLLEAGNGGDFAYVALADDGATALLAAPLPAPVALPIPMWVRVRPFVAAFVLVFAGLLGLHVWDQMRLAGEENELVSAPGEWGGGGGGGIFTGLAPRATAQRPTPSPQPTRAPVSVALAAPLDTPTARPTDPPPATPTQEPTLAPTEAPPPTQAPTTAPRPTLAPTPRVAPARVAAPLVQPTAVPVYRPTVKPPVIKPPAPRPTVAPPRPTIAPPRPTVVAAPSNWSAPIKPTAGWNRSK